MLWFCKYWNVVTRSRGNVFKLDMRQKELRPLAVRNQLAITPRMVPDEACASLIARPFPEHQYSDHVESLTEGLISYT